MDKFTKFLLCIIAVSLVIIAVKLWEPTPAYSGFINKPPTLGDWWNLKTLKGEERKKERMRIMSNIPLIRIHGYVDIGNIVDVDIQNSTISVEVDNTVDVHHVQ